MSRACLGLLALLLGGSAGATEKLGVIAVGDPPGGPDLDLTELTHQLRAACRDRVGGIEDVSNMRARLLGQGSNATLSELDRAYGGALAVYQNGEFESSVRTLRAIVEDLEGLPESEEVYFQWKRALLRLAHAEITVGAEREADAALAKLARTEHGLLPDPEQYSPTYRRRFEEVKRRVAGLPKRRLALVAEGNPGAVYLNGRLMGMTPLTLTLPAGSYRIGGASGTLRIPSFTVDLEGEDRSVVLDFALADALRVNAGPGLALLADRRAYGIVRAGAWLGVDKLIVASRVLEGQAQFLLGSMYDVRRGALLREGSVRMVAGSVPSVNLAALASFLLTGQSSREVKDRTQDAPREIPVPPVAVALSPATPPVPAEPLPALPAPAPATPPLSAAPSTAAAAAAAASGVRPPAGKATAATAKPERNPALPEQRPSPAVGPAIAEAKSAIASTQPAGKSATASASQPAAKASTAAAAKPVEKAALTVAPAAPKPSLSFAPPPVDPAAPPPTLAAPRRAPTASPSASAWMRPAALGAGALAIALGGLAVQQGIAGSGKYSDARKMIGADGSLIPGADPARYRSLRSDGDAASRNAYISAGAAVVLAGAAGVLGWISWDHAAGPEVAVRF